MRDISTVEYVVYKHRPDQAYIDFVTRVCTREQATLAQGYGDETVCSFQIIRGGFGSEQDAVGWINANVKNPHWDSNGLFPYLFRYRRQQYKRRFYENVFKEG